MGLEEQCSEITSALKGNTPEPEPNSATADPFCILEKSPKKADVSENVERRSAIEFSCNAVT